MKQSFRASSELSLRSIIPAVAGLVVIGTGLSQECKPIKDLIKRVVGSEPVSFNEKPFDMREALTLNFTEEDTIEWPLETHRQS